MTPATVKRDVERWLAALKQEDPKLDARVSVLNPVPRFMPPYHVSNDEYVVRAVARGYEQVTGKLPRYKADYGAADSGNLQYFHNIPCIVFGPAGATGSFTPPEYCEIEEIVTAAKVYALAALDITTKTREEIGDRYRVPLRAPAAV
jgi:acetylornithine deacetylase/succinyl-diaminopimelate desuccinylase-like protein